VEVSPVLAALARSRMSAVSLTDVRDCAAEVEHSFPLYGDRPAGQRSGSSGSVNDDRAARPARRLAARSRASTPRPSADAWQPEQLILVSIERGGVQICEEELR
jgi:hypothetical protein